MEGFINAIENTPLPIILVLAGVLIVLLSYVTRVTGIGGIEVHSSQKKSGIFIGLLLIGVGIVLHLAASQPDGARISSNSLGEKPPTSSPVSIPVLPVPVSPTQQPSISSTSPELLLNEYTQSLTGGNFEALKKIYPRVDEARERNWLEGDEESPIVTVQVVGQPERIRDSANEVILRATMQYCRQDRSGSTDDKNYMFSQKEEVWQLNGMSAAENVTPIRC